MEAKEKANNLVISFYSVTSDIANRDEYDMDYDMAKKCALIAVDEIIWALKYECPPAASNVYQTPSYWSKVKQEIENL